MESRAPRAKRQRVGVGLGLVSRQVRDAGPRRSNWSCYWREVGDPWRLVERRGDVRPRIGALRRRTHVSQRHRRLSSCEILPLALFPAAVATATRVRGVRWPVTSDYRYWIRRQWVLRPLVAGAAFEIVGGPVGIDDHPDDG